MSEVVVSTPPPTVMNTIDSATSRATCSPSISWWAIAVMASSRGSRRRSSTSSRIRVNTGPNAALARANSGLPFEYAAVSWKAERCVPVLGGKPSHARVTEAGTGREVGTKSHRPTR